MLCFIVYYRGADVSVENLHQVFTHVFESTFESVEPLQSIINGIGDFLFSFNSSIRDCK